MGGNVDDIGVGWCVDLWSIAQSIGNSQSVNVGYRVDMGGNVDTWSVEIAVGIVVFWEYNMWRSLDELVMNVIN